MALKAAKENTKENTEENTEPTPTTTKKNKLSLLVAAAKDVRADEDAAHKKWLNSVACVECVEIDIHD
tara:strand:- start:349 stop:552 length:204 start_codon:yes stop_codon:yes gene_type:complete